MLILVFHSPVLPVFGVVPPELQILNKSATFTFNCTPSEDGYPAVSMYVFQLNGSTISNGGNVEITGVSGSILTVSSLKRSEDSGNYTCMVTNEAGSVTIATYLSVLGEYQSVNQQGYSPLCI